MPLFDVRCTSCGVVEEDRVVRVSSSVITCNACGAPAEKLVSRGVHSSIDESIDGSDIGKNVREKNDKLKASHGAYSYEEPKLRERTQKFIEEKLQQ